LHGPGDTGAAPKESVPCRLGCVISSKMSSRLKRVFERVRATIERHQRPLLIAIVLLIGLLLIFIFYLGNQLQYEAAGAREFKKGKYDLAAQKYLLAYDAAAEWSGRDRYLFLVAQCYYNTQDWSRAYDFYLRLNKEFPQSHWVADAQPFIERTIYMLNPDSELLPEQLKARSPLARARADVRASYTRLVAALKENKAGVSVQLEREYQKYRKANERYRSELTKAYAAVAAGGVPDPEPSAVPPKK
jgi:tetratricopeptide (TPR) repeat protein